MPSPPRPCADFILSVDFVVSEDFIVSEPDGAELPVADGELPLVSLEPVVAPVPDDEPLDLPVPLCPCASAGAAANARATASAIAPVNVFIALPPAAVGCWNILRAGPQPAWRRSSTGLRKSCATGGVST